MPTKEESSKLGATTKNGSENGASSKTKEKKRVVINLASSFWVTRILLLRYIAFIYLIAFLVALNQNDALIGTKGLLPVDSYLERLVAAFKGDKLEVVKRIPTLFVFVPLEHLDLALWIVQSAGLVISATVVLFGYANMVVMGLLWLLYMSVVHVGQRW